jgi:dienelactone hydrolase
MKRLAPLSLALLVFACVASPAIAAIKTEMVDYKEGDTQLSGFLAYDDAAQGKQPAILVVHEWYGLNDYAKHRAEQLAGLGYVAFAADIYGKGVLAKEVKDAAALSGKFKGDRPLLRARVTAALETLKKQPNVDTAKIGAIGYCFGGTTVLELARSGADVAGVVSFHGGLGTPMPAQAGTLKAKILACHGADDPFISDEELLGFRKEMQDAKADWQLIAYGNAVHSFTNPAQKGELKGAMYNAEADQRSWRAMQDFFNELFGATKKD